MPIYEEFKRTEEQERRGTDLKRVAAFLAARLLASGHTGGADTGGDLGKIGGHGVNKSRVRVERGSGSGSWGRVRGGRRRVGPVHAIEKIPLLQRRVMIHWEEFVQYHLQKSAFL